MTKPSPIIEYLFLDKPRIERYFHQLSSPVHYDKVPVWKVALGLTGPSIEGTQSRKGREFTFQEKLDAFLGHLQSERLISSVRPSFAQSSDSETPFVTESLWARRARIERDMNTLNIWVSLEPDLSNSAGEFRVGPLYLIEDFQGDDNYPRMYSGYSSLYLLAEELDRFDDAPGGNALERLQQQDNATRHFASDPIGALETIGAKFGPKRHVRAIYRVRALCIEENDQAIVTVGYPLVINEEARTA